MHHDTVEISFFRFERATNFVKNPNYIPKKFKKKRLPSGRLSQNGLLLRYVRDPFPAAGSDQYVALRAILPSREGCDAFAAVGIVLFSTSEGPLYTAPSQDVCCH